MSTVRSGKVKQSVRERQTLSLRGLCEGRGKSGPAPIGEARDSVRGLARAQYLLRVSGKGYGGCLVAWVDTKRTVEVKRTPEEGENRPSEHIGRKAKTEGRGQLERCVTMGAVPIRSNAHQIRLQKDMEGV